MKLLRTFLKWIGIAAGAAVVVLLVFNAYYVWSTGTRLERRLMAFRRAGDPVRLADLARGPIPPEKNADTYLRRAADDLDSIQKEIRALYPMTAYPPGTLSSTERETLETLFAAHPEVMPLLEQAADCPDYDPQFDFTSSPTRFIQPFLDHTSRHRDAVSCPARPLHPAAVSRPHRRCARHPDPLATTDAAPAQRADAHGVPGHGGLRERGHGGGEPGLAGRADLSPRSSVTRCRARPSRQPGGTSLGPQERTGLYLVIGPRNSGLGFLADPWLRERPDVRLPGALRSPPGRRFEALFPGGPDEGRGLAARGWPVWGPDHTARAVVGRRPRAGRTRPRDVAIAPPPQRPAGPRPQAAIASRTSPGSASPRERRSTRTTASP